MSTTVIRPISAVQARPLRGSMLRPGQPPENLVYPGDDAPTTWHVGAFVDDRLLGVASIYHEPPPAVADAGAWRLRGMAVATAAQRRGIGRQLIEACVAHAKSNGGTNIWCNARATAADFYTALGFQFGSAEFDTSDGIPHYVMLVRL